MQYFGFASDAIGRRPMFFISMVGAATCHALQSVSESVWLLYVGAVIHGATAVTPMIGLAYLTDLSTPDLRGKYFGIMEGLADGVGIAGAIPISSLIADAYGVRVPFRVATLTCLANLAWTYFLVPESLPESKRRPAPPVLESTPVTSLLLLLRNEKMSVRLLTVVFILFFAAQACLYVTWVNFAQVSNGKKMKKHKKKKKKKKLFLSALNH